MHFDQRTQRALRKFGLSADEIREVSEAVVEATAEEATALEAFFEGLDIVYSDMDQAHSTAQLPEHGLEYVDCYTHAGDLRGYVKFDGWGVPIEDGRVLSDDVVELSLGPTVHDRVRFAADREHLWRVRVRGIYTTALTELLREEWAVVQASPPIRERFDAEFEADPADATVRTTDDRQGVGASGEGEAVEDLRRRLLGVGRDAFDFEDPAPKGAVFRGVVTETLGSGAVVDLGENEGFLPYDRTEGYVEEGDSYRLQVARAEPPWTDSRPSLATDLRVPGGLVELRRGGRRGNSETARMAELLPVDPPEGWTPRWSRAADDATLEAMGEALERASERAETVMEAIANFDDDEPGRIVAPQNGAWVWFGRECRFALDDHRAAVETTMPGHHRIKAGADDASAAVDFAEAVCEPSGEFPFDVTTRQFGPREGDTVAIGHGKPSGRTIVLGRGEVTDLDSEEGSITVEREMTAGGTYDALGVERRPGDVATTTFVEGRWWYATVYRNADGDHRGTYVNVCTPVEIFPGTVRYVDLHVDVVKHPDGEVRRVDDDELDEAVVAGEVTEPLAERARQVAGSIENAL